jgi:hypothetical protein
MSKAIVFVGLSLGLLAAVILLTAPVASAEEEEPKRRALRGRWDVVFEMPQGSYETPVEFTIAPEGAVTATVLGPLGTFRITNTAGRLDGNKLTLAAETSYGKVRLDATLEGDRLHGKWFHEGLVQRFFLNGEVRGLRNRAYVSKPPLEVFDVIWSHIERSFYTPDFNGIDASSVRRRYRGRVAAVHSDGEFLSLMRQMLGEFRTSHFDLFATPSWSRELHSDPTASSDESEGLSWRQAAPSVGYLRIESFEDGPEVVARVDGAFADLGSYPSLVIDLRGNTGGTLAAAMRLGDYVLPQMQPVGYFASRDGLTRHSVRSIDRLDPFALPVFSGYDSQDFAREMASKGALMLATGGRAERRYSGRVVVLIDENCFSASEAFASVVKETRAATLIGRRTAGAMLSAAPVPLTGGWTLLLPIWDFRTAEGVRVEGRGVEPDITVKYAGGEDADLAAALEFLKTHVPARSL